MDFIPKYEANLRGTGIDKQYTDFCKEVLEYFSAGDGAIKNKDSIGNLTLLDYKTNREYQDAPFHISATALSAKIRPENALCQ